MNETKEFLFCFETFLKIVKRTKNFGTYIYISMVLDPYFRGGGGIIQVSYKICMKIQSLPPPTRKYITF